jgi:two-component system chemotaxis response regulator CheB
MDKRNIIVIGASAGGFEAIKNIVRDLPTDLDASVFIVWHMAADMKGVLPDVLNRIGKLPAANAYDGEPIKRGRIYVAPPDRHMLLEKGQVRITRGPKENRFRPAVDPLFRSAAIVYGFQVIGIILSGALDDGTAGLWAIKQQSGITIVQDPADAEVSSMPEHAVNAMKIDYVVPVNEIGALIRQLVNEQIPVHKGPETEPDEQTQMEVLIAMENKEAGKHVFEYGDLSPYTCPECHGVLSALREGNRIRFRCHTGHAFSADSLLAGISENIEESLWSTIRSIQESTFLLNHMGDHFAEANQSKTAAIYFKKAKEAMQRMELVRLAVLNHEQLSTETIQEQSENEVKDISSGS